MNNHEVLKHMKAMAPEVAEILKVLGHPKRLLLLCLLKDESDVGTLALNSGLGQSQTSQILTDLERRSWLTVRAQGKQRFYQLSDPKLIELFKALYHIYCRPEEAQS